MNCAIQLLMTGTAGINETHDAVIHGIAEDFGTSEVLAGHVADVSGLPFHCPVVEHGQCKVSPGAGPCSE